MSSVCSWHCFLISKLGGQNPSGFSTNLGRWGNQHDYNKAVEAAGAVQSWNNANDNYNNAPGGLPGGTSGLINDHYYARGDSHLIYIIRNSLKTPPLVISAIATKGAFRFKFKIHHFF